MNKAVQIVLRILTGDVGVGGIEQDAHFAAGIGEDSGAQLCPSGEVDKEGAAGVGAVVDAEGVHGCDLGRGGLGEGYYWSGAVRECKVECGDEELRFEGIFEN